MSLVPYDAVLETEGLGTQQGHRLRARRYAGPETFPPGSAASPARSSRSDTRRYRTRSRASSTSAQLDGSRTASKSTAASWRRALPGRMLREEVARQALSRLSAALQEFSERPLRRESSHRRTPRQRIAHVNRQHRSSHQADVPFTSGRETLADVEGNHVRSVGQPAG